MQQQLFIQQYINFNQTDPASLKEFLAANESMGIDESFAQGALKRRLEDTQRK